MNVSSRRTDHDGLAERVVAFLTRQNAWFERVLDALRGMRPGLDEAEMLALAERHAALMKERAGYERELAGLTGEWRKAAKDNPGGIPELARARIRTLAKQGESLTEQVHVAYESALAVVGGQARQVKSALDALKQGRSVIRKYAPGHSSDALFIDRKA